MVTRRYPLVRCIRASSEGRVAQIPVFLLSMRGARLRHCVTWWCLVIFPALEGSRPRVVRVVHSDQGIICRGRVDKCWGYMGLFFNTTGVGNNFCSKDNWGWNVLTGGLISKCPDQTARCSTGSGFGVIWEWWDAQFNDSDMDQKLLGIVCVLG